MYPVRLDLLIQLNHTQNSSSMTPSKLFSALESGMQRMWFCFLIFMRAGHGAEYDSLPVFPFAGVMHR